MLFSRPKIVVLAFCLFCVWLLSHYFSEKFYPLYTAYLQPDNDANKTVATVVPRTDKEDASWLSVHFPDWVHHVYNVNNPYARPSIPKNKGKEAMVYLTYIINNYDRLPEIVLFLHATRFQWHNDNPNYDGFEMLNRLKLDRIRELGYVSFRCAWIMGCPVEVRPFDVQRNLDEGKKTSMAYGKAFQELFPNVELPHEIGAPCCSQFGVTNITIKQRPKEEYIRYRDWLLSTKIEDDVSGRIFEYAWHMIFGKPPLYCLNPQECYCKLWGLCDLECNTDSCEGRYLLPQYSDLPQGWPYVGWEGEARNFSGPPA